jgi:tRNA (cmo5U34)-methyltransferase
MSQFDASARDWDNNPIHWERSEAIAKEIGARIPLKPDMSALEFGAGTGILSFLMESHFREITLMDNSGEMVKVMHEKVARTGLKHLKPVFFDLETDDLNDQGFDCIFTQMAMHHVEDVERMVTRFYHLLNPDGWLAIADLYTEDGSFHGQDFSGHRGFDISWLEKVLTQAGFKNIDTQPCFAVRKMIDGIVLEFPVFLMTAKKPMVS